MNRELVRKHLDEEGLRYDETVTGFEIQESSLSSRTLEVLSIADADITDHDMYGMFWVVSDA